MANIYDAIIAGSHANTDPSYVPPSGLEVVFPGSVPAGVSRVTGEGLNVYSRPTYAVDSYGSPITSNSNPIAQQQQANAVAQALSLGRANGKATGGGVAEALALAAASDSGPKGNRLTPNAFGYGENGMTGWSPENTALSAIKSATGAGRFGFTGSDPFTSYTRDYVATARPAALRAPTVFSPESAGTGVLGQRMSPGMATVLNTDPRYAAQRNGTLGSRPVNNVTVRGGNRTQQALAQVAAAAPRVNASNYAPAPQYQSSGVANPAYRDYSGVNTSSGGGIAPSSSSGTFTDSLGGTYRDRNL